MSEIRVCPNCGAGIVGATPFCPRCDYPLESQPIQAVTPPPPVAEEESAESEPETPTPPPPTEYPTPTEIREPQIDLQEYPKTEVKQPLSQPEQAPPSDALTAPVPKEMIGITATDFENAGTAAVPEHLVGFSAHIDEPTEQRAIPSVQQWQIPPAPYTPPPLINPTTSVVPYSYPSNEYLKQRIQAYRHGGYDLRSYTPYQAVLTYGKPLSVLWWLFAFFSGIGILWYLFIMLSSGFSKDRVFLVVERDGTLYEDGAGAAHVRRRRSRNGQRWGLTGAIIFFISLLWFVGMVVVGVMGVQKYRDELREAHPIISDVLDDQQSGENVTVSDEDVRFVENAGIAYAILFILSILGMWSGVTLTLVGYLHGAAYRVDVPPLPEYV